MKKNLIVVLSLVMALTMMLTGCGKENVPVETTAPETVPEETAGEDVQLTGDWLDLQFVLDGVMFKLGDPYKKLEAAGWSFDIAELGYPNGYVLNPGDKVFGTIQLRNDAYDKKISVYIGLRNNSDQVKDIYDCDLWTFSLETTYGFKLVEPHPTMMIGNGIQLGDTHQQVLEACGPCEEKNMFVSEEYGYITYEYRVDFTYYLKITVYDEYGVTKIQLQDYGR
jgi:hypothetical protein